jgi:hypothetical protein
VIVGIEAWSSRAYMIALGPMFKVEFKAVSRGQYVWDFLQCFRPPAEIGYEKGKFFKVKDLDSTSIEYRYAAYKFGKTINGRNESINDIKKTIRDMLAEGLPPESNRVKRIQKVYNYVVFQRIEVELMKMLGKQQSQPYSLPANKLVKHLFYGTKDHDPSKVYAAEDGLDFRQTKDD